MSTVRFQTVLFAGFSRLRIVHSYDADPQKWPKGVTAANWLHVTAIRLFPDSKHANACND